MTNAHLETAERLFPRGTAVCVKQQVRRREAMGSYETEVVGVVEAWEEHPTGSWYAHGKDDKLWLRRLKLRKADGEITLLIIDNATQIARLEAASDA